MTASIGPAYADYRQLFIENSVTGNYIASETQSDLAGALGEVGISKKMHLSHFMDLLMLLMYSNAATKLPLKQLTQRWSDFPQHL